eukprot:3892762-Pyramimonas_sp.AAC.1
MICENAFLWASSSADRLTAQGVPNSVESTTDSARMLTSSVACILNELHAIERSAIFLEMFSGASGTTRKIMSEAGAGAFSVEKNDHWFQDATLLIGMLYSLWVASSIAVGGTIHF